MKFSILLDAIRALDESGRALRIGGVHWQEQMRLGEINCRAAYRLQVALENEPGITIINDSATAAPSVVARSGPPPVHPAVADPVEGA